MNCEKKDMSKKETINVQGAQITLFSKEKEDYISLTDIAKYRDNDNPSQIISLWLRTYSTIEYLGLWEKWINETNAIGIVSKSGRYGGGTFAHSDIAFKFAAWISAEFEL
jgi:hypothetical protein